MTLQQTIDKLEDKLIAACDCDNAAEVAEIEIELAEAIKQRGPLATTVASPVFATEDYFNGVVNAYVANIGGAK